MERKYETMLVTSAQLDEEATAALVGKFKSLIEANATIDGVDEWGKRRLAYPINKEDDGIYTLIHFTSGPDFLAELDRVYGITDGVLRSLIIAKPEGEEYVPPAPKAEESKFAVAKAPVAEAAPAEKAEDPAGEAAVEETAEEAKAEVEAPAQEETQQEEPKAEQEASE